ENHSSFDDDDSLSSSHSHSIIEEEIDFSLVYALHNFNRIVEGQASVVKGDSLSLLDDTNSYWWLVKVLPTDEIGYIPAENIETPYERLARLNKHRNINLTSSQNDTESDNSLPNISTKTVTFASPLIVAEESDDKYYGDEENKNYVGKIDVTTQLVVQHEKINDIQLVNDPEELKYADKQVINPESNHSMSQENNTISNNSVKVTGSETVEFNAKRTDDDEELNQQHRQEKNQQHRQEQQHGQEKNQQYIQEKNQQNKQNKQISQQGDDIRQLSQRSQAYQMKKQAGQLENNLTYDQSTHNPSSSNYNIEDVKDNRCEAIKVSLASVLNSDFIDFSFINLSDVEHEGKKIKTNLGRSFEKAGNASESTRTNVAFSESIKNAE
ncbi:35331_t:CDS:2, partial [Racocetra persica]